MMGLTKGICSDPVLFALSLDSLRALPVDILTGMTLLPSYCWWEQWKVPSVCSTKH